MYKAQGASYGPYTHPSLHRLTGSEISFYSIDEEKKKKIDGNLLTERKKTRLPAVYKLFFP